MIPLASICVIQFSHILIYETYMHVAIRANGLARNELLCMFVYFIIFYTYIMYVTVLYVCTVCLCLCSECTRVVFSMLHFITTVCVLLP